MAGKDNRFECLPECAAGYIRAVVRRVRCSLRVRREVCRELIDHFTDALGDFTDEADRDRRASELIEQFGDARLLGALLRRGKKRCRPLWKKAIIRSLQVFVLLIVFSCLYTWWLSGGTPTISVDYLAVLNERTRPTVPDAENAWENYERAIGLYVEPASNIKDVANFKWRCPGHGPIIERSFAELTASEQAAIRKLIKDNEPAWREFAAGSRKQHHWQEYSTKEAKEPLVSILLPPLGRLRKLAKVGTWRSRIALEAGHSEEGLRDCLVVAHVGSHHQRRVGFLIEQLVGIAISSLANQGILRVAGSQKGSAADLSQAQEQLEALYPDGYPMVDLDLERLGFMDTVQHCFTDGGPGGGHLIPVKFIELYGRPGGFDDLTLILGGMLYAGRDETVAKGNEHYRRQNEIIKLSPYQQRTQKLENWANDYVQSLGKIRRFPLLRAMLPSLAKAGELAYRGKALHEATITVLALRRWRLDNGRYPEDLRQLVSDGYLKAFPDDPYGDGPLKYERRGDDFVLYSLGANFADDDGLEDPDDPWGERDRGGPRRDRRGGDRVFWPVDQARQSTN